MRPMMGVPRVSNEIVDTKPRACARARVYVHDGQPRIGMQNDGRFETGRGRLEALRLALNRTISAHEARRSSSFRGHCGRLYQSERRIVRGALTICLHCLPLMVFRWFAPEKT